jgi:hypothetical protein
MQSSANEDHDIVVKEDDGLVVALPASMGLRKGTAATFSGFGRNMIFIQLCIVALR